MNYVNMRIEIRRTFNQLYPINASINITRYSRY